MAEEEKPIHEFPSAFSLFRPSFDALMVNIWTFLGLFLIPMAGLLLTIPLALLARDQAVFGFLAGFVGLAAVIFGLFVAPSLPYVQLRGAQERQVTLGEALRTGLKYFWRFYGVTILVGLIVLGGFILLIVPGVFMIKRYYLAQFYLYDQNVGVLEAMRRCAADSKKYSGAIWGLLGVSFLIGLPSVIAIFWLVSMVLQLVYYCAPAVRYLQIKEISSTKIT